MALGCARGVIVRTDPRFVKGGLRSRASHVLLERTPVAMIVATDRGISPTGNPVILPAPPSRYVASMKSTAPEKLQNMKHAQCILFVCVLALGAACNRQATAGQQLDKIQRETKAAANEMKDYNFAQKNEFASKMQAQLDMLNQELDQLSAKIEKSRDADKAEPR